MNTKTDNGDHAGKILIREEALAAAGKAPKVLDCYAGEGVMYQAVWCRASSYLGVEKRFARRAGHPAGRCWRGNNETLIAKAMQQEPWDVVDLDAYGNPWPMLRKVLKLATGKRLVVPATCGLNRAMATGSSDFAAAVSGASRLSYLGLMVRWYDDVIRWTLSWCVRGTGWKVKRARYVATDSSSAKWFMRYWLLEFERSGK